MKKILTAVILWVAGYVANAQQRPNLIFILADDLGWSDLPAYGNKFNEAPNLSLMAKQGALFTNAYAAAPVCSPTRASILSGQYPARVGVMDWIPGLWRPYESVLAPQNRTQYLPTEVVTIGEALQQSGYKTGYFGKWHLGDDSSIHHPLQQGFDKAYTGKGHYNVQFAPPYPEGKGLRLSEAIADMSESFIEENKNQPFFLFVAGYDPHLPLDADTSLIIKYKNKSKVPGYTCNPIYAAMIEHLDIMVGRILKKVKSAGLEDNTLIVFFSDNGGLDKNIRLIPLTVANKMHFLAEDSLLYHATTNAPLKGVKGNLYEGGVRVPMIVKYPKMWKGGTRINDIVNSVDFFPSFVSLAGAKMPSGQVFDGIDIFSGNKIPERPLFWHYPFFHHGVPASAVRLGDWKLIRNLEDNRYELYNLKKDNEEKFDLASKETAQVARLSSLLDKWLKELKAPMPVPNPDFDEKRRFEWGDHPSQN